MIQKIAETCTTITATCTLGAYFMENLPDMVALASFVWIGLNIIVLVVNKIVRPLWFKYKQRSKGK